MSKKTPKTITIGLVGAGVVGQGILQLLRDNDASIRGRLGVPIEVKRVVARQREKVRSDLVAKDILTFDPEDVLRDPSIDVVVEVIGGLEPAGSIVRGAIEAGKAVVTANKALLAEQGHELIELAEQRGADLYFEASVGGGIPVIRVLREGLASDRIVAVRGIVNGTSNYILSRMREAKLDFAVALREAQEKGYAEADPTLDVSGGDAAHKLSILATLAFGAKFSPKAIATEGIDVVSALDMQFAERFGYVIKPLAVGRPVNPSDPQSALDLRVHPALVPRESVLASVSGALNAIYVEGASLGPCLLSGLGAGALPTAMSVVSDIVDVGRNLLVGARGRVPVRAFRGENLATRQVADAGDHRGRFYLRFSVLDRPGVLAKIAGVLGAFDVSIEQMVQEGRSSGDQPVTVVMLTHAARLRDVRDACREIDSLTQSVSPTRALRIEES